MIYTLTIYTLTILTLERILDADMGHDRAFFSLIKLSEVCQFNNLNYWWRPESARSDLTRIAIS